MKTFEGLMGVPRFQKFGKASYRTVAPNQNENFSSLAQLESVKKSGELILLLGKLIESLQSESSNL